MYVVQCYSRCINLTSCIQRILSIALQLCYDIICPPFQYEPSKDVFNAAQSGAMVRNLVSHEFDYLVKQLESVCRQ